MSKLYASFEDLVSSHDALFRPHRNSGALNVCKGVWEAREPEVQSLKDQLSAIKISYDLAQKKNEQLESEASNNRKQISNLNQKLDATMAELNTVQTKATTLERDLTRLQKYEDSLDAVQRSQYSEIETQKKRFMAESQLRHELEGAISELTKAGERDKLEIMAKDDLITRLQARIDDLESRIKQQQRLNARMGVELDRFARENDQLTRAINLS